MRWRPFGAAFVLPLVYTAGTLALVTSNREAVREPIVLTEREAMLAVRNDDDSAASFWLSWQPAPTDRGTWLGREKLQELGFDCTVDPASADGERHYRRELPREAFVAFELDGPAWQALLADREREEEAGRAVRDADFRLTASRLVPVDAAVDAATLASRYPDGRTHLITAVTIDITRFAPIRADAYVMGQIANVDPRRIHVPRDLAARLPRRDARSVTMPFTVSVRYGRRWEPWVVGAGSK